MLRRAKTGIGLGLLVGMLSLAPSIPIAQVRAGDSSSKLEEMLKKEEAERTAFDWNRLGNAYFKVEQYEKAVDAFEKALEGLASANISSLKVKNVVADIHGNAAISYTALNQHTKTIYHAEQAIDLNPTHPVYHHTLGRGHFGKGHATEALQRFNLSLEIIDHPIINKHKKQVLDWARRSGRSIPEEDQQPTAEMCYEVAVGWLVRGKADKAADHYNHVISRDPSSPFAAKAKEQLQEMGRTSTGTHYRD